MDLSKSIDFLLENAGPVIQYRLRKEILRNITPTEEENLLKQIYQTPNFKLVQSYVKPNGYIGSGAHSWDNWHGVKLHETPLQDGEAAARLLSYYAVPKTHPIVRNFVDAMRDEETLLQEFSYIPPEIPRFEKRFVGINNGNCLAALMYTMQALLGYGDDSEELRSFQQICITGFNRILELSSIDDITHMSQSKRLAYPYIDGDEYFPNSYTLATLAHTYNWRTPEHVKMLSDSLNHINEIMKPDCNIYVKLGNTYAAEGLNALDRPIRTFNAETVDITLYRRPLTEIAMLGVGESVRVIRESAANVREAIDTNGILKTKFKKSSFPPYPTAYGDIRLEPDHKRKYALECDLTFWAVQFLTLVGG